MEVLPRPQEEEAQSKALDLLIQKKNVVPKSQDTVHELEESWINITESAPPAPGELHDPILDHAR